MVMPKARRTFAAERDLEEIVFQIAIEEERPIVAERILRELQQRCDKIAELASLAREGTSAPRLGDGVRLLAYKLWVIIFRYDAEGVLVLRIADGSQDYLSWKIGGQ
jgi:plasmid stabilization system protein ParE